MSNLGGTVPAEKYTTLIIRDNKPDSTGLFIKYKNKYFILSTAHQFWENNKTNFGFLINGEQLSFAGNHHYMNRETGVEKDFDFSLLEVESNFFNGLLGANNFYDIGTQAGDLTSEKHKYYLFGYPAKVKIEMSKRITYPFRLIFDEINFSKTGSPFYHVNYSRKKVFLNANKRSMGPIPRGCSGSGVWNIKNPSPILIGIMQEYDSNKSKIRVLKLDVVRNFIDKVLMRPHP